MASVSSNKTKQSLLAESSAVACIGSALSFNKIHLSFMCFRRFVFILNVARHWHTYDENPLSSSLTEAPGGSADLWRPPPMSPPLERPIVPACV